MDAVILAILLIGWLALVGAAVVAPLLASDGFSREDEDLRFPLRLPMWRRGERDGTRAA